MFKLQEYLDCVMSPAGGLAAAVGSAVCNGSFGTISRLDKVQRAQVHIISNSYSPS